MGLITVIGAVLQLLIKLFDIFSERDKEKKAKKKEAFDEVKKGISKRDPSAITAGFDRYNRI